MARKVRQQQKPPFTAISSALRDKQIAEWLVHPFPIPKIISMMVTKYKCSRADAHNAIDRVREEYVSTNKDTVKKDKAEAIDRHLNYLGELRDHPKLAPAQKYALILRTEAQLADLQGTKQPIKIDVAVQINQALQSVIVDVTSDQMLEAMQTYANQLRKADEYDRMMSKGSQALLVRSTSDKAAE